MGNSICKTIPHIFFMLIDDNYIKNKFITKRNQLAKNYTRMSWLQKHEDIYKYLINRYSDSKYIQETIYRIVNIMIKLLEITFL